MQWSHNFLFAFDHDIVSTILSKWVWVGDGEYQVYVHCYVHCTVCVLVSVCVGGCGWGGFFFAPCLCYYYTHVFLCVESVEVWPGPSAILHCSVLNNFPATSLLSPLHWYSSQSLSIVSTVEAVLHLILLCHLQLELVVMLTFTSDVTRLHHSIIIIGNPLSNLMPHWVLMSRLMWILIMTQLSWMMSVNYHCTSCSMPGSETTFFYYLLFNIRVFTIHICCLYEICSYMDSLGTPHTVHKVNVKQYVLIVVYYWSLHGC